MLDGDDGEDIARCMTPLKHAVEMYKCSSTHGLMSMSSACLSSGEITSSSLRAASP